MAEDVDEKVQRLKNACLEGFQLYPASCSHAVTHVIRQYRPSQHYMTANQLVHDLARNPEWQEVPLGELASLANKGILVVGGRQGSAHGHVIAVFPGHETPAGGYRYVNRSGEATVMRRRGCYARAMSTSMGNFPGAKSNGDKTVWDPWANDEKFKKVRFWKFIGASSRSKQREEAEKFRNPAEEIWI